MTFDGVTAIEEADEAYRAVCTRQGLVYALHAADRYTLIAEVVNAYLLAAGIQSFITTGGDHVKGFKQ